MTEYVMGADLAEAKRHFDMGRGCASVRQAVRSSMGSRLFKRVKTPGRLVWYNHTHGSIPEGVEVRWDAVMLGDALPVHLSVRDVNPIFLAKTPDTLSFPIRYPVIGRSAQDTFKVTELK